MNKLSNVKMPVTATESDLLVKASKLSGIPKDKIQYFKIVKKSLDARDKNNIFYNYSLEVSSKKQIEEEKEAVKKNVLQILKDMYGIIHMGSF